MRGQNSKKKKKKNRMRRGVAAGERGSWGGRGKRSGDQRTIRRNPLLATPFLIQMYKEKNIAPYRDGEK